VRTAVILAGGESRRMQRDKLALLFGGQSLLASAVRRFSGCFDQVWLSVNDPGKYSDIKAPRIVDVYRGCGPMGGLHAALAEAAGDGVFLVAADLPYADPRAALKIMELTGDADVGLMTDGQGRYEPLFAYYKKSVLPHAESALKAGQYKLSQLLEQLRLRCVTPAELGNLWSDRLLLNINYPQDYEKLIAGGS
jgi:molybdopterin-guanine dinucleotide biosynthesis protein A